MSEQWSEMWDSNSRPRAPKARALSNWANPGYLWWVGLDLNQQCHRPRVYSPLRYQFRSPTLIRWWTAILVDILVKAFINTYNSLSPKKPLPNKAILSSPLPRPVFPLRGTGNLPLAVHTRILSSASFFCAENQKWILLSFYLLCAYKWQATYSPLHHIDELDDRW